MTPAQIATATNAAFPNVVGKRDANGNPENVVLYEDLSNIVQFMEAADTTYGLGAQFNIYFPKIVDKIGYTVYIADNEGDDDEFDLMRIGFDSGSIVEMLMFTDGEFVDNTAWDTIISGVETAPPTFDEMFGLHKAEVNATYTNHAVTLASEVYTITYKQWKSAVRSPAEYEKLANAIAGRWTAKIKQLRMMLKRMQVQAWALEKKIAKSGIINLLGLYKEFNPSATTTAESTRYDKDFLRFMKVQCEIIAKDLRQRTGLFNPNAYVNPVPRDRLKFLLYAPYAKYMEAYSYADTYHDSYVKLDGYSEVTYWQGIGDGLHDDTKMLMASITQNSGGSTIYQDGVVGVMFDERAIYQTNEEPRTAAQRNEFGNWTNYQNQLTVGLHDTLDLNGVVLIISDYQLNVATSSGSSAPSDWATQISNGIYIEDGSGGYSAVTSGTAWAAGTRYYNKIA